MADKKQRTKKFLLDLTSLEINTLVTENIAGKAMGEPRQAIEEIHALYASKLDTIAATHGGSSNASPRARAASSAVTQDSTSDHEQRAEILKQQHEAQLSKDDHSHLSRISDHSHALKGLLAKLEATPAANSNDPSRRAAKSSGTPEASDTPAAPAATESPPLGPEDMVALRKIWELGVEPIAAQTVVQIGGDVITRVHPKYASGQHPMLLELHQAGTSIATGMWGKLIDTAVLILDKLIDR